MPCYFNCFSGMPCRSWVLPWNGWVSEINNKRQRDSRGVKSQRCGRRGWETGITKCFYCTTFWMRTAWGALYLPGGTRMFRHMGMCCLNGHFFIKNPVWVQIPAKISPNMSPFYQISKLGVPHVNTQKVYKNDFFAEKILKYGTGKFWASSGTPPFKPNWECPLGLHGCLAQLFCYGT